MHLGYEWSRMPFESAIGLRPSAETVNETLASWTRLLQEQLPESGRSWLRPALQLEGARFSLLYARAGRKLGFAPLSVAAAPALPLPNQEQLWPACDIGRVLLLCEQSRRQTAQECAQLLRTLFAKGDNRERVAVLRSLLWLQHPESGLDVAIDACRSHVQDVFEAIACENTYPAAYFPDLNFNQMVLKAFFTEVAAARIAGLAQRQSEDLKRMALAYASERSAAGRSVPADLNLATQTES